MLLEYLYTELSSLHYNREIWLAYSGGLDSHVLLHAAAQLRQRLPQLNLRAIHIHHGLSPYADQWVAHCQAICTELSVTLICEYIHHAPLPAESIEAWARESRYRIFADLLPQQAVLLTAHTQDDQAETVLLQLLRGAGVKGLAAMPKQQTLGAGLLYRPLLDFTRNQLQEYALENTLSWIEDESNLDSRFDRNFLRHHVLPVLRKRWPSAAKNIARSARHCAEAADNLAELAELDLTNAMPTVLSIELLQRLSPARQRNVLRHWLHQSGCRLPNTHHIHRIQEDLICSRPDSQPQVSWGRWTLRRYRDALMLATASVEPCISGGALVWDLSAPLELPQGLGRLSATRQTGAGLTTAIDTRNLTIRFRQGGERCRAAGARHTTSLKKLFQRWGVPPWQRNQVPLLYHAEQLAAVIPYCICEPFAAGENEVGWVLALERN